MPPEVVAKMAAAVEKRWEDPIYKKRTSKSIKDAINNNPKEIQRRSEYALDKYLNDPDFYRKWTTYPTKLSKPHQKIRELLKLDELGFKSEQRIGRYTVDELNEDKKIIIEIYGDYFHANPKIYAPTDEIKIKKGTLLYTAQEKWNKDLHRIQKIQELGYKVIVIWQSDDLEPFKQLLSQIFV